MPAKVRNKYGTAHQRLRAMCAPLVATGTVRCWRCGLPIEQGQAWDLGHRPGQQSQPEHRSENRSAGAVYGNAKREPRTAIW